MASINKVIIIGRVGKDPELRYAANGAAVCNLSLATSRKWKNKQTGEQQEETEWHRVSLFDRLAEVAGEYLKKGSLAYIEGRLKTRKWTDKDGVEKYTTEIMAENLTLLSGREQSGDKPARTHGEMKQEQREGYAAPQRPKSGTGFDDMDDDIPF